MYEVGPWGHCGDMVAIVDVARGADILEVMTLDCDVAVLRSIQRPHAGVLTTSLRYVHTTIVHGGGFWTPGDLARRADMDVVSSWEA